MKRLIIVAALAGLSTSAFGQNYNGQAQTGPNACTAAYCQAGIDSGGRTVYNGFGGIYGDAQGGGSPQQQGGAGNNWDFNTADCQGSQHPDDLVGWNCR